MSNPALKVALRTLLRTQPLGVLATQGGGQPYANLVAFASTDDLKFLLFATQRRTRKYANIQADPRASLLVDNRSNRVSDFQRAIAATATGAAREVGGAQRAGLVGLYLSKHPHLEDFVAADSCALFEIEVDAYTVVHDFQEVETVLPD